MKAVKYEMRSMNANVAVVQEGIPEILQRTDAIGNTVINVGSTLATQLGNLLICQQRILPELENYVGLRLDDHMRQIVAVLHTPQAANFPRQAEIQKRVSQAPI